MKALTEQEAKRSVGKVLVGQYWPAVNTATPELAERRRVLIERVWAVGSETRIVIVSGFDMDRGGERSFCLAGFTGWTLAEYAAEAEASKPTAAVVVDDGRCRRVSRCDEYQSGFCEAKRMRNPGCVVYPISAAI